MSHRKIAERLVVSEFKVKRHVANVLAKLGLPCPGPQPRLTRRRAGLA